MDEISGLLTQYHLITTNVVAMITSTGLTKVSTAHNTQTKEGGRVCFISSLPSYNYKLKIYHKETIVVFQS